MRSHMAMWIGINGHSFIKDMFPSRHSTLYLLVLTACIFTYTFSMNVPQIMNLCICFYQNLWIICIWMPAIFLIVDVCLVKKTRFRLYVCMSVCVFYIINLLPLFLSLYSYFHILPRITLINSGNTLIRNNIIN